MEFQERTIKVIVDDSKCPDCKTKACIEACKLFARGILVLKDGRPMLNGDAEFAQRVGTECLACEYECWFRGNNAIKIEASTPGLDAYRTKRGLAL